MPPPADHRFGPPFPGFRAIHPSACARSRRESTLARASAGRSICAFSSYQLQRPSRTQLACRLWREQRIRMAVLLLGVAPKPRRRSQTEAFRPRKPGVAPVFPNAGGGVGDASLRPRPEGSPSDPSYTSGRIAAMVRAMAPAWRPAARRDLAVNAGPLSVQCRLLLEPP